MSEKGGQSDDGMYPADGKGGGGSGVFGQQIQHRQVSARVPEGVARGVFSTGAIVLTGASEFCVDFLLRMARPHQVATRVVLPHAAMPQLTKTLRENIARYEQQHGAIEPLPKPDPNARRPSIQEVYDELKMPEEVYSGHYANACIIGHSPAEFVLDFVTNFFPQSAVSARVYLSARQAPRLLEALEHALGQLQKRVAEQQQKLRDAANQNPGDPPADTEADNPPPDAPPAPDDQNN